MNEDFKQGDVYTGPVSSPILSVVTGDNADLIAHIQPLLSLKARMSVT